MVNVATVQRITPATQASTIDPGHTEIRARVFTYLLGTPDPVPDNNPANQRKRIDQLRDLFLKAFDGDLILPKAH